MEKDKNGYVYLLQINDEKGNKVYKFGKSNDIEQRMKNYKFKKILFTLISDDYSKLEADILLLIKNKYKIIAGREYFECDDEKELIKYILQYALNIDNIDNKIYSVINEYKLIEYKKNIEYEFNDKIKYLEQINNDKYNLIIELNNKKEELEKKNLDIIKDYDIKYEELNNIIKDYENKKNELKKIIKDYEVKKDNLNKIKDNEIKNKNFNNNKIFNDNIQYDDTEDYEEDHINNNISTKNDDTKNMCIYCNKKFTRRTSLRRHIDLDRCSKK